MKYILRILLVSCFWLVTACQEPVDQQETEAQVDAKAKYWLSLVDHGDYEQSIEEAAHLFRRNVTRVEWQDAMVTHRLPLGEVVKRELVGKTKELSLPNVGQGEFWIYNYQSQFVNNEQVAESLIFMKDEGVYKVVGYWLK